MSQATPKPCRLCGQTKPLRNSHIFPKFYWDWLKETGGTYFRTPKRPNQRMQDGYKRPLLCGDCEERFSAFETATALSGRQAHRRGLSSSGKGRTVRSSDF